MAECIHSSSSLLNNNQFKIPDVLNTLHSISHLIALWNYVNADLSLITEELWELPVLFTDG